MKRITERSEACIRKRKKIPVILAAAFIVAGTICIKAPDVVQTTWQNNRGSCQPQFYAWWGTLYPEFCFEKGGDTDESQSVKLSFWLAKALDW